MDRLVAAGGLRDWAPRAFREFAQERPLHAIGTRGFPWIEIDFPEDYRRAVRDVLPQIDGADGRRPRHAGAAGARGGRLASTPAPSLPSLR